MGRLRIVNDYLRMSDADLIAKAANVNSGISGNSNYFPGAAADLGVLNTILPNFDAAVIAASTRDNIKIALKNNVKADLINIMRKLSSIITHSAPADDKAIWLASGFTISGNNNAAAATDMGAPQNFTVEVGKVAGQVTMSCDKVIGGRIIFLYAPIGTAPDTWKLCFTGEKEFTLTGLPLLQQFSFRAVSGGPKGVHQFSEIIVKTVV